MTDRGWPDAFDIAAAPLLSRASFLTFVDTIAGAKMLSLVKSFLSKSGITKGFEGDIRRVFKRSKVSMFRVPI